MNPETNKFEVLSSDTKKIADKINEYNPDTFVKNVLLRPDGSPVPKHWSIFTVGEKYVINDYTFKCAYIGETSILFEPVGPVVIGENKER